MSAGKGIFGGRLRRTRGADSKKIETIAVDEKRIAPDPVPSAKDLYASAKEIEALVYRLAEKWKLSEQSFWEEIDRLCQKYGRAPDILSIRLVEELIKSYEQHWRSLKSSERWDADLWDELRRLVHKHHEDPTQKMIDYQQQMTFDRQESLRKMDDFMQAVESQYQSIKQLQHEITELEQQRENETTKQDRAVQAAKEEHNAKVEAVILQAQDKLKQALEEQAKLRREALLEAQQINSQEKRIMQEGFDKAIKEAQAKMESEKIEFRRELQAKTNTEVATIVQENATLKTKLDEATTNVQEQVDKIRKDLDDEINRLKDEIEGRSKAFDKHLDGVTQAHATEINNLKDCHEGEKKDLRISLNREIQELKFEISDLRESNKEQILLIEQRNGVAKRELEESHKTTTAEMQRSFDEQTVRIKERHLTREKELEARISQLIKDHKAETTKLRNTISTLETEHLQEKKQMNSAFDEEKDILDRKITAELTRLRADFKAKKELLESSHAEATSQLRNDVEAYSQALLARDDFKPMPDNEIKSKFEDLAEEVKNLGRLEWQEGQTVWPAQVIKRLSTNTTLFKRRILQEMIWVILHKHIFCSPFRAFGEEGEIMERKWNDAFGADPKFENGCYTWPQPEMEAERWRYVNVKECRTALRQPVDSEWDPRAKLKMGFRATLEAIRNEFTTTVGELVVLEKANIQLMDKISKKAANVWLEYGMQRCRIVFLFGLSSLQSPAERIRQAREGAFDLLVVPELRRYGNSKGLELHTEATVAGCGGEIVEVFARKSAAS